MPTDLVCCHTPDAANYTVRTVLDINPSRCRVYLCICVGFLPISKMTSASATTIAGVMHITSYTNERPTHPDKAGIAYSQNSALIPNVVILI